MCKKSKPINIFSYLTKLLLKTQNSLFINVDCDWDCKSNYKKMASTIVQIHSKVHVILTHVACDFSAALFESLRHKNIYKQHISDIYKSGCNIQSYCV